MKWEVKSDSLIHKVLKTRLDRPIQLVQSRTGNWSGPVKPLITSQNSQKSIKTENQVPNQFID